jgi:enamine deaminase RidA (YjgF/YER057c/UK114 family)
MSTLGYTNYPGSEANSKDFHYSQAVQIGNIVKISGQGGWDAQGNIAADIHAQVLAAFQNVESALKSIDSRLSWEDVYSVHSYHTNVTETFDIVTSNFKQAIPDHRPIWTCVEVVKLGIEGMVIEIEVEAMYPF